MYYWRCKRPGLYSQEVTMSKDVKVLDVHNWKFPIRTMQYMIYPSEFKQESGYGRGEITSGMTSSVALKLHITAEVMETKFASFLFDCSYNTYVIKLRYGENLVDFKFIDGSNSYLYIKEKHYRITETHTFSKDDITEDYYSLPYLVEIGRDSRFL